MNNARLETLADDLDDLAEGQHPEFIFHMGAILDHYARGFDDEPTCKTAGCMAGWVLFHHLGKRPGDFAVSDMAAHWLELDKRTASRLFFASEGMSAGPAECAIVVRNLIKTGEVDWSLVRVPHGTTDVI